MTTTTPKFTISKTVSEFIGRDNSTVSKAPLVRNTQRKYLDSWISREKNENGYYLIGREFYGSDRVLELYTDGSVLEREYGGKVIKKYNVDINLLEKAVYEYRTKLKSILIKNILLESKRISNNK